MLTITYFSGRVSRIWAPAEHMCDRSCGKWNRTQVVIQSGSGPSPGLGRVQARAGPGPWPGRARARAQLYNRARACRARANPPLSPLGTSTPPGSGSGLNFWPPRPRDPLQGLGRIGGRKSPLVSSKSVVIGPKFGQKTVWPMYALVYPAEGQVESASRPTSYEGSQLRSFPIVP